jgi:hypothetical protein
MAVKIRGIRVGADGRVGEQSLSLASLCKSVVRRLLLQWVDDNQEQAKNVNYSFVHMNRPKRICFFATVRFFCQYAEIIGRIEIGKFLSVRPIFSVFEKLDGYKKSDGCKTQIRFLPVCVNEA